MPDLRKYTSINLNRASNGWIITAYSADEMPKVILVTDYLDGTDSSYDLYRAIDALRAERVTPETPDQEPDEDPVEPINPTEDAI